MSDPVNDIPTRKVGVTFQRKISDGNYGGTEASAWVEGTVPAGANPAEVAEALGNLYTSAKAAVLDELGIEWHLDPDTAMIKESNTPMPTVAAAQAAVNNSFAGTQVQSTGDVRIMNPSSNPIDQWAINGAIKDGVPALWDNRDTAKASEKNLPWYKEAVARGAQGHGKDGGAKGYWPPK